MKALRTIPAMLKIAEVIKKNAPDAWLINYTNPTGIVSQAVHDYTDIKCAALCVGGIRTAWNAAAALGVESADVQFDVFGLNHLNFSYNIKIRGRPVSTEELPPDQGEQVLDFEKEIYADFRNPAFDDKPPSLKKRGGGGTRRWLWGPWTRSTTTGTPGRW